MIQGLQQLAAKIEAGEAGVPNAGVSEDTIFNNVLSMVFFFFGIVAVITIVFAGIMYITSEGDAQKIKQAKNAVLYGVIGLVITSLAFTVVGFILNWFGG